MSSLGSLAQTINRGFAQKDLYDKQFREEETSRRALDREARNDAQVRFRNEMTEEDLGVLQGSAPTRESLGIVTSPKPVPAPSKDTGLSTPPKSGGTGESPTKAVDTTEGKSEGTLSKMYDWVKENPLDAAATAAMFVPGVGWVASGVLRTLSVGGKAYKAGQAIKAAAPGAKVAAKRVLGNTKRQYGPGKGKIPANKKTFDTKARAEASLRGSNYPKGSQSVVKTSGGKYTIAPSAKNIATSSKFHSVGAAGYLLATSQKEKEANIADHRNKGKEAQDSSEMPTPIGAPTKKMEKRAAEEGRKMSEEEAVKVLSKATKAWNSRKLAAVLRLQEGGILPKTAVSNFMETGSFSVSAKEARAGVKSNADRLSATNKALGLLIPGSEAYFADASSYWQSDSKGKRTFNSSKAQSDVLASGLTGRRELAILFGKSNVADLDPSELAALIRVVGKNRSGDYQGENSFWGGKRNPNLSTGLILVSKMLAERAVNQGSVDIEGRTFNLEDLQKIADDNSMTLSEVIDMELEEKDTSTLMTADE